MDKRPIESASGSAVVKKFRNEIPILHETDLEKDTSSSGAIPIRSIPELPTEILAEIFKFLSLRERRNASLVCNKWYQAASFPTYSLNEKLVFRGYQNVDILLSFLSHTKREFLNLEFHGCEFNIDNPSNLLSLTEKIHSLNFMDCTLSVPFASQLLSQCHYLNEFHIGGKFKIIKDSNFIRELVESLFKKQFVNENLKVLHMNVNTSNLTDDKKELLLNMFPNIKNPKFQEITCSHFYIDYVSCISSLLERIILMKDTLETLKIFCCEQRMQLLVPHNFTRLKKIFLHVEYEIVSKYSLCDFLARQENLEKISLKIVLPTVLFEYSSFVFDFISNLINRCSHLKHLELVLHLAGLDLDILNLNPCHLNINPKEFLTLISSNLISLKLYIFCNNKSTVVKFDLTDQLFTMPDDSPLNETLQVLRIPCLAGHKLLTLFIQYFRNLKLVDLMFDSEIVFDSIRQFQKNLTSLKLKVHPDVRVGKNVSNIMKNCLRSLPCLESLDLLLEYEWFIFDCEMVPLSVKDLRLSFFPSSLHDSDDMRNSLLPLKNVTGLEAIHIRSSNKHVGNPNTWLEICSSLKKLRLLNLRINDWHLPNINKNKDPNLFYEQLFIRCPSLRCSVLGVGIIRRIFFYDQVDGKFKPAHHKFKDMNDFVILKKIAGFNIKFYNF